MYIYIYMYIYRYIYIEFTSIYSGTAPACDPRDMARFDIVTWDTSKIH